MSKLVNIDGRFYELKISPAGDKLTLTASAVPLGSVTNPNDGFRAMIYGDQGFLKIRGKKGTPVAVPEGQWKLLSYTIDATDGKAEKGGREEARRKGEEGKEGLAVQALGVWLDRCSAAARRRRAASTVAAQATDLQGGQGRQGGNGRAALRPALQARGDGRFFEDGEKHKNCRLACR